MYLKANWCIKNDSLEKDDFKVSEYNTFIIITKAPVMSIVPKKKTILVIITHTTEYKFASFPNACFCLYS